jgi:glyoxylate reductase
MSTPRVIVTRAIVGDTHVAGAEVLMAGHEGRSRDEILASIAGADVIVSMFSDRVDDAFLDAAGDSLKAVCNYAVGYDNIDVAACARRNVVVTNTPGAVTEGTADLAWALILGVARLVVQGDRFVRAGEFARQGPLAMTDFLGRDLTGRTLLIVGAGRIGYATALRSSGWGMRVLYVARSRHLEFEMAPLAARRVTLEEGLAEADVVSIHTPLTEHTRHLIDARAFSRMKPTAILINTARGPIVDESALAQALKDRRIWGAGIDVYEREPEIHPALLECDNAILTPHIGSAEERWRNVMTDVCFENVRAVLRGERAPNTVG